MRIRPGRLLFVVVIGAIATVLGIVTSLTLTPPGRALLARAVSARLDRSLSGSVSIGAISGSFLSDLTLERVVIRDTAGVLLADLPRVRVTYLLPRLLAGEVVLGSVELDRPVIQIVKRRNGRMNYEDVLRLGHHKGPGGPSPLVEFRKVRVAEGVLRIILPWNPPDTARTPTERAAALAAERAKPGRIVQESPDGLERVVVLQHLTTVLGRLLVSSPDGRPFTLDLDSLATRLNDPAVTITDAAGRLRLRGDSAIFSLSRGALPHTDFSGGGAVTWPHGGELYDFEFNVPRLALADLRWISPHFPAMTGSGTVAARSETPGRTVYVIRNLRLREGPARVEGELTTVDDRTRGVGARDMNLTLQDLDLDAVRPYADSLPFYGTLSGRLQGGGYLDRMQLNLDWTFTDFAVPGRPVSHVVGDGVVGSTRGGGLTFTGFRVRESDVDLATVHRITPSVKVPGRLAATGILNGPLRDVVFEGTATHRDGARPASTLDGTVRLDNRRKELGVDLDVQLEPLAFDGIRRGFPGLTARGSVTGRLRMDGTLSRMLVQAQLAGEIGQLDGAGVFTMLPPHWAAESLAVRFHGVDLQALGAGGPATRLNGVLRADASLDTLRAPTASLDLSLGPSRVREWALDSVHARGTVRDSLITLDTAFAAWRGARASGAGTLGWVRPHNGTMNFSLVADSLGGFDSLLLALTREVRDSANHYQAPLQGTGGGALTLSGSLDSLALVSTFTARGVAFQGFRSPGVTGTVLYSGGTRPSGTVSLRSDSVTWRSDSVTGRVHTFGSVGLDLAGRVDSLAWAVGAGVGAGSRVDAAGWWDRRDGRDVLGLDSLAAGLIAHAWRLSAPTAITLGGPALQLDSTEFAALDGSGVIRAVGAIPGDSVGALALSAIGVDLRDVYDLLSRDTTGIAGQASADLSVGGTAALPTFTGSLTLAGAEFGDARIPYVEGVVNYGERRLDANLTLWRTGNPVLGVAAELPLDLAFRGVAHRRTDGPLSIRAHGDSVDLAVIEAFAPALQQVRGWLTTDAEVQGTWKAPRLSGSLSIRQGALAIPALRVRWDTLRARADFAGDSIALDSVHVASDGGALDARGAIRLADLSRPVLALALDARRFKAMNIRNFLDLTTSGQFRLDGPFYGATFTGRGVANAGALYFADLVNKRVIDLTDPTNLDLVDTTALRRRGLGEGFQSRFIDELRVRDLAVTIGSDFWLRSGEANIKLRGDLRVNKTGREYRYDGTLDAGPGTYTLKVGPVTRDFTVQRGTVTYFGTPDLNAALDIEAQHLVRAQTGQEIPVIARITGTLLQPRLELKSDPAIQPPLAEVDLVSYLMLGVPASQAQGVQQNAVYNVTNALVSAVSSDLERALVSDFGFLDLFEIRTELAGGTTAGGTVTQFAAGWQLGSRAFLRLSAGFCAQAGLSYGNLGASVDYRLSRHWRAQASFEPTFQTCRAQGVGSAYRLTSTYQVGSDLLWERDF